MNVMYYVNKYEHAATFLFAKLGLSRAANAPGLVVLEQHIHYHKEVFANDLLEVESWVVDFGRKVITLAHEIRNPVSEHTISTATMKYALIDRQTRRAIPIPDSMHIARQESGL